MEKSTVCCSSLKEIDAVGIQHGFTEALQSAACDSKDRSKQQLEVWWCWEAHVPCTGSLLRSSPG